MDKLRRYNLRHLLATRFEGDRGRLLSESGLSKGRLSQLLSDGGVFGDNAAKNLEERLRLPEGYFDTMNADTLRFAMAFDALPSHIKEQWEALVSMLGKPQPGGNP